MGDYAEDMRRLIVGVGGMTCSSCVQTVQETLEQVPGVSSASVSLRDEEANVTFCSPPASVETISSAIEDIGFEAWVKDVRAPTTAGRLATAGEHSAAGGSSCESLSTEFSDAELKLVVIDVQGMTCQSCVQAVTEALSRLSGVGNVTVDLERGVAEVLYKPEVANVQAFCAAITDIGFEAALPESPATSGKRRTRFSLGIRGGSKGGAPEMTFWPDASGLLQGRVGDTVQTFLNELCSSSPLAVVVM